MIKPVLFIGFLLCRHLLCFAQIEKIDTDRPDQTETPATVPKKWIQFETGFSKQVDKYTQTDIALDFQHPTLLSKYGLTKSFEFRLITTYSTFRDKRENHITYRKNGISDVQLGGKVNFFDEKGLRPRASLIAHYDFGKLRTVYKDTIDGANFRFTMQHTLSNVVSLAYNLGMEWGRFDDPAAFIYTFAPGFNIGNKWYGYIELFGFIWQQKKPQTSIDGGIGYFLNDNLKLDLSSGFGISKTAPDWYVAVGGSVRFKTGN